MILNGLTVIQEFINLDTIRYKDDAMLMTDSQQKSSLLFKKVSYTLAYSASMYDQFSYAKNRGFHCKHAIF